MQAARPTYHDSPLSPREHTATPLSSKLSAAPPLSSRASAASREILTLETGRTSQRAVLFLLVLTLSLLVFAPTAWAQQITATLRIEHIEDTRLAPVEVTLEHRPLSELGFSLADPGFITPFHVLAEGLEQVYGPGEAQARIALFGSMLGTIDGSFGSTAGEPNVWWMFAANQSMPVDPVFGWGYAMNQYPVQDGDEIDFLGMWGGQWGVASPYLSFFHSQNYEVKVDQSFDAQILGLDGFDDFGQAAFRAIAGAEILIDPVGGSRTGATTPSGIMTNAQGVAELSFDEAGTYLLSAKRPIANPSSPGGSVSDITRPFAIVTVTTEPVDTPPPPPVPTPEWDSSRGNTHNSGTTDAQTPGVTQSAQALWSYRVSDGSSAVSPVKIGDYLYIAGGTTLFKFDAAAASGNGAQRLVARATLASPVGPAAFITTDGGKVFVPLDAGRVQAFDAATLESVWISEGFDSSWQSFGMLNYADGYVYGAAGRDRFMVESEGSFFALDAATGEKVWTYSSTSAQSERGFYWSGAAHIETSGGDALLFAGDDGMLVSHRAGSAGTGVAAVIDRVQLPGGVRSAVLFVPASDSGGGGVAYVSTRNGYVARISVAADGSFVGQPSTASLSGAGSTATPVVYKNRLFVVSGELLDSGHVDVFNATSLERLRSVELPGFSQSSPLLSTRTASAVNGYEVSLFVALNDARDDVVRIVDSESSGGQIRAEAIFRPGGSFTLSSVSACGNGGLYYTDGRGYLTALVASDDELPPQEGGGNGEGDDNAGDNGDGDGSYGQGDYEYLSTDSTRTASAGPTTGDFNDVTPWLIAASVAAIIVAVVISKNISDCRKEMFENIAKYHEK